MVKPPAARKTAGQKASARAMLAQKLTCPAGGTSFARDVAPLFNQTDIDHMKSVTGGKLDLSDYASVSMWAQAIYVKVQSGDMPPYPYPAFTPAQVNTFGCWIQQGLKP